MNQFSLTKIALLAALCFSITGCLYDSAYPTSTSQSAQSTAMANGANPEGSTKAPEEVRTTGGSLGGYIEQFMDANDKSKLARALDGSIGKATSWKNPVSGAMFAVTPVRKVSMGDSICRAYSLSMVKGGVTDKVGGTACIGDDGLWHTAG